MQLAHCFEQLPDRLGQQLRLAYVSDNGSRTLELHIVASVRIDPGADKNLEIGRCQAPLATQLWLKLAELRQTQQIDAANMVGVIQ
ncbi:hypothetical protein D3C78_1807490 [compost metagenome]